MSVALPAAKQALITIWSAQVAQLDRIMKSESTSLDAKKMGVLMLSNLKSEIEGMIANSGEEWTCPGFRSGTIADVLECDWERIIVAHKYRGVVA